MNGVRETQEPGESGRAVVYCLVPRELASKLHEPLRRHFNGEPGVEVIVERRGADRRTSDERRSTPAQPEQDRRRIRAADGRRVGDRRASLVGVEGPSLPRKARPYADRIAFVERLEPSSERAEDLDTARLVARIQAGERSEFAALYQRYFDRVYNYLRLLSNDPHAAEDLTQQVFMQVLEALPRYERRRQPFRAWLFRIVRNSAIDHLQQRSRLETPGTSEVIERRELEGGGLEDELPALDWISDPELMLFVERLPLPQRQVLLLRYMVDLSPTQIGELLGRRADDVRALQYRALSFLRTRLTALGRGPCHGSRSRMRRVPEKANVLRARRFALRV